MQVMFKKLKQARKYAPSFLDPHYTRQEAMRPKELHVSQHVTACAQNPLSSQRDIT